MVSLDSLRRTRSNSADSAWKRFIRWLRRRLPMGLYARSLLIVVIPMVLLQSVVAFVFMERHWQLVTQRLSAAVTNDIAAIVDLITTFPQDGDINQIVRIARDELDLNIAVEPGGELPPPRPKPFFEILDQILSEEISNQIRLPFWIDTVGNSKIVEIRIKLEDGRILRVYARRNQAYASNTHIFLVWMVGASLVLLAIAILFLRGQIRPILALANAAESFGKGQKIDDFAPRGAEEIRRAGLAFILMRERIERQIEQRTAMLTGVSHDLRTILTRFKLQLALSGDNPDPSLNQDVEDMQNMLEGYLAFARGEAEEDVGELKLSDLMARLSAEAELYGKTLTTSIEGEDNIRVRPNAFTRLVANLASNAYRYADTVRIDARHTVKWLTITIDDDGPGIPEPSREDVFKPFFRLDEARNLDSSGTGLGLAIARDIARSHGGNVTLGDSTLGGLRATVRVPA
ncbi:ATP-binding protein [Sinorhizobium americanum]|uniref:histidine kinase n=1 Tax=Sinorhizobium americanum TaxID=194963 RepID=A0A1L3LP97_9HYPH|nr:ATP-binding protein [Sinorhizobium americanum]APG85248.1 osmolarity sensor protein EnvZ [Sinorhizobium americanum CCGM7]APG91911.1 osmolarity sensor protein EnvZ [Sinorhizobium americanum]OAP34907.1 ATPase [Sinorhizobium americanum]TCN32350.1 two-component system osmolarity sensor histidine kinase EnvZ [Sinorhizobium americanum]